MFYVVLKALDLMFPVIKEIFKIDILSFPFLKVNSLLYSCSDGKFYQW